MNQFDMQPHPPPKKKKKGPWPCYAPFDDAWRIPYEL